MTHRLAGIGASILTLAGLVALVTSRPAESAGELLVSAADSVTVTVGPDGDGGRWVWYRYWRGDLLVGADSAWEKR